MLSHLDFPQILDDEYGGWLSATIVEDFTEFADVCFREFGDRVSYWTTIDEPNVSALGSYDNGLFAPGRCSDPFEITNCTVGNSTVEHRDLYMAVCSRLEQVAKDTSSLHGWRRDQLLITPPSP